MLRSASRSVWIPILLAAAVLTAGATGCDCEGRIALRAVAEMRADPDRVPADGRPGIEVSILVFQDSAGRAPLQGIEVEVRSDRNDADSVDAIEQPSGPTDADGRAVAFVGSTTEGTAELSAWSGGEPLCVRRDADGCVPAVVQVTFERTCPSGQTACDGECVDLAADVEHCGSCETACSFANAAAGCTMGQCVMGECDPGYADCDRDAADGCESLLASDPLNCGSCDNACGDGEICRQGDCAAPCADADADGYEDSACGGPDCADDDPGVHPGAAETCNGSDDDCDGQTDEDLDGAVACDDQNPCTADRCEAGVGCQYDNLDGEPCDDADVCTSADTCLNAGCFGSPLDADSDGYRPVSCGGADCDDSNAQISPSQTELGGLCSNGVDDDCDGQIDGDDSQCEACGLDSDCDDDNPCNGVETCQAGACQAGSPPNCDDGNVCTSDACDPAFPGGCTHEPALAACDDGQWCTVNDQCDLGQCTGQARDCSGAADACNQGVCDEAQDSCVPSALPDDTPCEDGLFCTDGDVCQAGTCQGGPRDCSGVADQCNSATCDEGADVCQPVPIADGSLCSDGFYCTTGDACNAGVCQGQARDCSGFGDQCNQGVCDEVGNTCSAQPLADGTVCSDGLFCTDNDQCAAGVCGGAQRDCSGVADQCNTGTCDELAGACTPQPAANGTACDDGDACSMADACSGGLCGGVPLDADGDLFIDQACGGQDCDDSNAAVNPGVFEGPFGAQVCSDGLDNDCDTHTDGADTGCLECTGNGDCDDGDVCNGAETCQAGSCVAGTPLSCNDDNACTDDSCDAQAGCQHVNHSRPCDDGLWCTLNDVCSAGACVGSGTPCNQQCLGTCNEAQQQCDPSPDGTGCNDGQWCTQNDLCTGGTCGGAARDCSAAGDQCHAGVCNDASDSCVPQALPDGTGCNDGLYCTTGDVCTGGSCGGFARNCSGAGDQCNDGVCDEGADACVSQPKADGTLCADGAFCTVNDSCTGGTCGGADRDCSGAGDQCNTGVCSEAQNLCVPQAVSDGTSCNDGLYCTVNDACTAGLCGGAARDCSGAGDQCNTGVCNDGTDRCEPQPRPDGTGCDDTLWCTRNDVCTGGACNGAPRDCSAAGNQCNTGVCDDGIDQCVPQPVADGSGCNDGAYCTVGDQCTGGTCGGAARDCSAAADQCNAGVCVEADEVCEPQPLADGTVCDDLDPCTMADECTGGVCAGPPLDADGDSFVDEACPGGDDCDDGDPLINPGVFEGPGGDPECNDGFDNDCDHLVDLNDPGCGECFDDGDCDDGDVCNGAETCDAGSCQAGTGLNCNDSDACTDDGCDPVTGCEHTFNTTPCNDGQYCTLTDTCDGAGNCVGAGARCVAQCMTTCDEANDECDPSPDGTGCDDGEYCTVSDQCTGGVCGGAARDCSAVGDQCNDGVCDDLLDQCTTQAKADGVPCEDGLFCTAGDTCDGAGACSGGVADPCPLVCQTICNEGANSCDDDPNGTPCDDGDACTLGDDCTSGACSGTPTDGDSDGYVWDACAGGDDCNDGNPSIHPGATEVCDGVDNDCDGHNDQRLCPNQEGVCAGSLQSCSGGDWQACNYGGVANHEWVEVSCDGLDNDCDGCTDEGCAGYANPVVAVEVIPYTSRPGLSRVSGNGQAGPVGAVLPNALLVQLNDGSGNPRPGELVTFAVEPAGAVCYGQGGIYSPSNGLDDLVIHLVCNDVDSGALASPAQVRTDVNGQAEVYFQLPPDVPGMSGVSATAAGQTVEFFASSTQALADNTPLDLPSDNYSPPDNPSVGPLNVTIRSGGSAAFLGNPDNYSLTITELSSSVDAVGGNGVADAPLTTGGTLTISGRNFSTPANSNSVWIGGLPATVTGGSASSLTVQIPAGTPGAAAVVVDDGTSTAFAGGSGNVPSIASAVANLWRLAPKPIYIFAATGSRPGSTAQVKLLGRDVCGNPLDLAGESISLWTEDPNGASPSGPVSVGVPDPSTGVATVANTGAGRQAAFVVGSVGALSSDDFSDGNTTVTTVAWTRSPATFVEDPALANDDGINSIIFRGGTGDSGETNNPDMNPAVRFTSVDVTNYVIPDGAGPDYETEANIVVGTMIGEGNITFVPGSNRRAAMAGTGLLVASGSPSGVLGTVSANANYCIRIIIFNVCGEMSVEGVLLPGWYRQTGAEQEYEMNHSGLMYYDVNEYRNLILRLLMQRVLP